MTPQHIIDQMKKKKDFWFLNEKSSLCRWESSCVLGVKKVEVHLRNTIRWHTAGECAGGECEEFWDDWPGWNSIKGGHWKRGIWCSQHEEPKWPETFHWRLYNGQIVKIGYKKLGKCAKRTFGWINLTDFLNFEQTGPCRLQNFPPMELKGRKMTKRLKDGNFSELNSFWTRKSTLQASETNLKWKISKIHQGSSEARKPTKWPFSFESSGKNY